MNNKSAQDFWSGVWRLADPKITLASAASLFVGACAAAADGPLEWGWLGAAAAGIFFLEAAKNASGEIFDFDSGADLAVEDKDRSPFSGGKRVLVDGILSRGQTITVAAAAYALGAAIGLFIVVWKEPRVLALGLAGVILAYGYHAPPLRLSYRGFGEAAVALCYGPLIGGGLYLMERGVMPFRVWAALVPVGLMIGAFLWINEFPDYEADKKSGKNNLVVLLGRRRASLVFPAIIIIAAASLALLPLYGWPRWTWLGAAFLVPALQAAAVLLRRPESTPDLIGAQARVLVSFLILAGGIGIGILLV